MAGASMKDIKLRIKSVEGTRQITKAMELVASSKLRHARELAENSRPFFNAMIQSLQDVAANSQEADSPYIAKREVKKECIVLIAGDRGLAGGYNSNVLKVVLYKAQGRNLCYVPIGKKALEFASKNNLEILTDAYERVEDFNEKEAHELGLFLRDEFLKGTFDHLEVFYTQFRNMLSQVPHHTTLLPVELPEKEKEQGVHALTLYEPNATAVFNAIIPDYLAGVIYGAAKESFACEQASRRMAMDSASKNAGDMIEDLSLKYNRARQGAITQELTEIVAGSESKV